MNRRTFIKKAVWGASGLAIGTVAWGAAEAKWCGINRVSLDIPSCPSPFKNTTIAVLSDIHHGPFVPISYVNHVVAITNALVPDIVCLLGDYVHRSPSYIEPCITALGELECRFGVFAVLGNHDHWEGAGRTRKALKKARITELTNRGVWLQKDQAKLRICGVGDLWEDVQDPSKALGHATQEDTIILLSHNPDYAEYLTDTRADLMLSGHTHGGQVNIPGIGAPVVPSTHGNKYVNGLVKGPTTQVFITKGVGTITPPLRYNCPPEVALITIK